MPKSNLPSDFDETLACLEDTSFAAIEAHPRPDTEDHGAHRHAFHGRHEGWVDAGR